MWTVAGVIEHLHMLVSGPQLRTLPLHRVSALSRASATSPLLLPNATLNGLDNPGSNSKLYYCRRSASQSVLVLLSLCYCGAPFLTRGRACT
jgi:hypothetical protein